MDNPKRPYTFHLEYPDNETITVFATSLQEAFDMAIEEAINKVGVNKPERKKV